jgi:hypothetical protein
VRRVFWIALGASVGVIVVWRVRSAMDQLTPENVAARAGSAVSGFWSDVTAAARQREAELRAALGIDS